MTVVFELIAPVFETDIIIASMFPEFGCKVQTCSWCSDGSTISSQAMIASLAPLLPPRVALSSKQLRNSRLKTNCWRRRRTLSLCEVSPSDRVQLLTHAAANADQRQRQNSHITKTPSAVRRRGRAWTAKLPASSRYLWPDEGRSLPSTLRPPAVRGGKPPPKTR